jgi:thioredoxin-related protein
VDSNLILNAVNITLTVATVLIASKKILSSDSSRTKKILIESTPDFIAAKSYGNSIKKLMSTDDKKVTMLMLLKYLMLTSKEAIQMERDLMEKIKNGLCAKEESENVD